MMNSQPFPPPSVTARQQAAPGGEKYETPEWILQGFEWQALDLMDEIHEEFNEEYGTDFEFQLRPKEQYVAVIDAYFARMAATGHEQPFKTPIDLKTHIRQVRLKRRRPRAISSQIRVVCNIRCIVCLSLES